MFRDMGGDAGLSGYTVHVQPVEGRADPVPENNTARFLVRQAGGKPLLCVPASPASRLPQMLASGGVKVVARAADRVEGSLEELAGFSGVVIENTRADALGFTALRNLAAWVEHAGGGLLLTGGRHAFGMGGYYKSPLEAVLPVSMELRREHRKFSMTIIVVLDRSGSMAAQVEGGKTKMDLANLGTMEVLNLLSDQDEMGVIAVDSAPHIVVNRSPVARVRQQSGRILGIESMGGGIFVYEALKAALLQMTGAETGVKHVLLFADAADSEAPGKYRELLQAATGAGVTVSVVGLGSRSDSDAALLEEIASLGGGSCSFTENAFEVPRLFAQDTFMVARNTLVTNPVAPRFTLALPQLSDALPPDAPPVGGYNLCYLKPEAVAVAVTSDEHAAPLVAMRRFGHGRALAFTGEADGELSGPFARWASAGEFYGALARHCAGPVDAALSGFMPVQETVPGGVRVTVHVDEARPEARAVDGLDVRVLRHRPGQPPEAETVRLAWRSADTLAAELPLKGGETLLGSIMYPDGRAETLPPVCLPYSPEYAPSSQQDGAAVLAALADATGGRQVADVGGVWETIPSGSRWVEVAPAFYLLAALLFLFEVFERRTGWLAAARAKQGRAAGDAARDRAAGDAARAPSARASAPPQAGAGAGAAEAADRAPAARAEEGRRIAGSPLSLAKRRANARTRNTHVD
jgi:hypothetical protein